MMDQINSVSRPALMGSPMLKGMGRSPLESVLLSRHLTGMPSMKTHLHAPSMNLKMGRSEMQPKVKPLEGGFRAPSLSRM